MRYRDYAQVMVPLWAAGVPVALVSEPGTGKSRYTEALLRAAGRTVITLAIGTRAPEDIGGLPFIVGSATRRATPDWAKRLIGIGGDKGALNLEELGDASPMMQGAVMRLLLDDEVADEKLPPGIWKSVTLNPSSCNISGYDLAPALANRMAWISWNPDVADWCDGLVEGFPTPAPKLPRFDWQEDIPLARSRVATYLRRNPMQAAVMPENEDARSGPWPSRRTWTFLADAWAAAGIDRCSDAVKTGLASALIGSGTTPWIQFEANLDLPDPEEALADPNGVKVPKRGDAAYAFASAVAAAILHDHTEARWKAGWHVLARIAGRSGTGHPAAAAVAARTLMRKYQKQDPSERILPPSADVKPFFPLLKAAGLIG